MKKISRKDLQGLRQQFPVLTKELMRRYVGGLTDNYCGADWFSDTYVMAFSSEGGSSYGYGGGGTYDGKPDWWTDGNYNLPKPYDNDETFNGGELDEVVIYGNRPDPKPYLNLPTEPEEPTEPDFPIFPPNPPTSPDDNQGNRPGSGGGLPDFGLPNWPYNGGYSSSYGGYGYSGGGTGGGRGSWGGGESSEVAATSTFLDGLTGYLKQTFSNLVTGTAEVAFNVYEEINDFLQQHPGSISTIRDYMRKVEGYVKIETDPNKMEWDDLFNIWLFELSALNMSSNKEGITLFFTDNAQTTKDLQTQEGVLQARNKAIGEIKKGNLSVVSNTWSYDVNEFIDGVVMMNTATSFLGSYNTSITIVDNHNGTYKLTYTVSNTTGWESGTRLRVDHDGDNIHDAIIPNCDRGEGVGLGGTISEKWTWSEIVTVK